MSKSDKAFRTITEAAEILGLPAHVLRFWESKFKYIKPMKRGGGRRYYRPEDLKILHGIKHLLYNDGLTIRGAQKVIQTNGVKAIARLAASGGSVKQNPINTPLKKRAPYEIKPIQWPPHLTSQHKIVIKRIPIDDLAVIIKQVTKVRDSVRDRLRKKGNCVNEKK